MKTGNSLVWIAIFWILGSCHSNMETGPEPFLETNDSFVTQPLGFNPTEENILNNLPMQFEITRTPIQNKHNNQIIDTLIRMESVSDLKDHFLIYGAAGKEILKEVKIRSSKISLKHDIHVGMSKEDFARKLKVETWPNLFNICNTEQTEQWIFYFGSSNLDSILYLGYLE